MKIFVMTLLVLLVGCSSVEQNSGIPSGLIRDPDSVIPTHPRLEVRSDLRTKQINFWIVTDSLTGCDYMLTKSFFNDVSVTVTLLANTCKKRSID